MPLQPMKYHLGAHAFTSKEAIGTHCQAILAEHRPGPIEDAGTVAFVAALLDLHPARARKVGPGIATFLVRAGVRGNREFGFLRVDGSVDNFSYHKCLTPINPDAELVKALRYEIASQQTAFMERQLAQWGEPARGGMWHVDHIVPFADLWRAWLTATRRRVEDVRLLSTPGGDGNMLADRELAGEWQRYHQRHARFQLLRKEVHEEKHATAAPISEEWTVDALYARLIRRGFTWTTLPDEKFDVQPRHLLTADELAFIREHRDAFHARIRGVVPLPPKIMPPATGTVRVPAIPQGTALGSGQTVAFGWIDWDQEWPAVTPTEPRVEGVR